MFFRLFTVLASAFFLTIFATWDVFAVNNCTGATYYDSTNDTCIACPAGYDYNTDAGKTSINQCQTHCAAGTYVARGLPSAYTKLEYIAGTGTQYITTNLSGFNTGAPEFYVKWMRTANPKSDYEAVFRVYYDETHNTYRIISSTRSYPTRYLMSSNTLAGGGNMGAVLENNVIHYGIVRNGNSAMIDGVEYTNWRKGTVIPSNTKLQIFGQPGFVGRIYALKVWKNSNLFANFIPARRNSDDVLGLYDTVNNVFYTNSGSGSFVAGPVGACDDAWFGYYAPQSVVNYGSTGTHNACPAGTYSDVLNGSDISDCKTCTGTTYSGAGARVCTNCPAGYNYNTSSGKTNPNQCQISCGRGKYVSRYTQLEYLQSNGLQEIVTNLDDFDREDVVISPKWMQTGPSYNNYYAYVVGVYESENHNTYRIITHNQGRTDFYWVNGNSKAGDTRTSFSNIAANTAHTAWIGNNSVGIDGTYIATTTKGTLTNVNFDVNDLVALALEAGKVSVDVMRLLPVRRDSDGVLGMYDTISGDFYTNSGSGNFKCPVSSAVPV